MIIRNISGAKRYFAAGRKGIELAAGASGTVADTVEAFTDVAREVAAGTAVIVDVSPEIKAQAVTPVRKPVGTLVTVSSVADTNVVTIEGITFKFNSTAGTAAGYTAGSTVGVYYTSDAVALTNLKTAINANATLAALKIVATDKTATTLLVVRYDGDYVKLITTSATGTTIYTTDVLAISPVGFRLTPSTIVNTNQVVFGGITFKFNSNAATAAGYTTGSTVGVLFSTDADALTNLQTAINANATLAALGYGARNKTATTLDIFRFDGDYATAVDTSGTTGTKCAVAALTGGLATPAVDSIATISADCTGTTQSIYTGLKTVAAAIVVQRAASGGLITPTATQYDGAVTFNGGTVLLGAGTTSTGVLVPGAKLTVIAYGTRY